MHHRTALTEPAKPARTRAHLRPEFQWMPTEEVLHYMRLRRYVKYFPVVDEDQTDRGRVEEIMKGQFRFNDESYRLGEKFDWLINPSDDIEWAILLHKFYYAPGLGKAFVESRDLRYLNKWMNLISSWIDGVPVSHIAPDVTGRRVQNWIFSHYFFINAENDADVDPEFYAKFLWSIDQQVEYLCANLTPKRNHRTLELTAIFLAGVVFPELDNAGKWLDLAIGELDKNISADILEDGVQCELSTDYHHIVLRNYLRVCRLAHLNSILLPAGFYRRIEQALSFAMHIHKPDGRIPSLSDGDEGRFGDLLREGANLFNNAHLKFVASAGSEGAPPECTAAAFEKSGYYVLRSGWGGSERAFSDEHHLVFDCGPLGEGNHGHFDLLSIAASAYGRDILVDPGRFTYNEPDPADGDSVNWRAAFRSTQAHNTVTVDNTNQTRYIYNPRKKRSVISGPAPGFSLQKFRTSPAMDFLHGTARSAEYNAVHQRRILFVKPWYWLVIDTLHSHSLHDYDLRFHLAPLPAADIRIKQRQPVSEVRTPFLTLQQLNTSALPELEDGWVSVRYGVKHPAPVVRYSLRATNAVFVTLLFPLSQPEVRVEMSPVALWQGNEALGLDQAVGLKIAYADSIASVEDQLMCRLTPQSDGRKISVNSHLCEAQVCLVRQRGPEVITSSL